MHLRADADDAALVKVRQSVLAHVGDVARDLLRPELGVTRFALVAFDMDGGEDIVPHQPLADEDGVLVVVALPRHICHSKVSAKRELAMVNRRAIGKRLTRLYCFALMNHWTMVDAC